MNDEGAPGNPEGSCAGALDYPTNRVLGAEWTKPQKIAIKAGSQQEAIGAGSGS